MTFYEGRNMKLSTVCEASAVMLIFALLGFMAFLFFENNYGEHSMEKRVTVLEKEVEVYVSKVDKVYTQYLAEKLNELNKDGQEYKVVLNPEGIIEIIATSDKVLTPEELQDKYKDMIKKGHGEFKGVLKENITFNEAQKAVNGSIINFREVSDANSILFGTASTNASVLNVNAWPKLEKISVRYPDGTTKEFGVKHEND
jgi:hypothetical protein